MEKSSFPPNYVTLKQLQELRLKEAQQTDAAQKPLGDLEREREEEQKDRLRTPRQTPTRPDRWGSNGQKPIGADPETEAPKQPARSPMGPPAAAAVAEVGENPEAGESDRVDAEDPTAKKERRRKKKKKNWRRYSKEGENRTEGDAPVRSHAVEPDRTGGKGESRGEAAVSQRRRTVVNAPANGGDSGRRGGPFPREWRSAVGPRQGLVWVRKATGP